MREIFPEKRALSLLLVASLLISALLISCSGSSTKMTGGNPTPTPAPGASPNPGPSPSPSPTTGMTFLYVGVAANQGGVQGFHVDPNTGALAEVPGSPVLFGNAMNNFSQAGPLAGAKGHVFIGFGPPNFALPVIRSYAVDSSTGSLGNFTETSAGASSSDAQIRGLITDPAGRNLYAIYQTSIASFAIASDGSLNLLGTLSNLATAGIFSLTIDPAANFAFLVVDNCPPKGPCGGPPDILLLDRDPNTGLLSNSGKMAGLSNSSPGALGIDPSGAHLIASTVGPSPAAAPQISVFSIDSSGALTPAAGSPHPTAGGLNAGDFRFDSTGRFLYVLNSTGISPQPESVTVYAFDPQSGAMQQLESQSLPPGNFPSTMLVENSFVFVVNSQAGTMPSVIYSLPRNPNTGMVSAPSSTLTDRPGGTQAGLGDAAVLSF